MAEQSYMVKPLEVFAIDGQMNRATGSIPYTSLTWHRKYHECGEFSMTVPASIYDPSWYFIETDERPETGIVQKVQYTDDPTYGNDDTVTISGFFLESIMNRRTFLDETPEEVTYRYYVSPPRPPKKSLVKPDVYKDADGRYWYSTPSGSTYGVYEGTPSDSPNRIPGGGIQTDESGQAYIDTGSGRVDVEKQTVTTVLNAYYYNEGSTTSLNQALTYANGTTQVTQHDLAFDDGFGHSYYLNGNGVLTVANGVTKKKSDNYTVKKRQWASTTDNGWVTVTKTVKGPWQTTDTFDPITPMDNIKRCVQWAQMYYQNEMLFEEPDITGEEKAVDPSFMLLGDLLYQELQTVGASFRVEYDFINAQFIFSVWRGVDRTQSQSTNPWAVFSDTWGSLYGYDAQRDDSNYRNKCYVLYDYDLPNGFDSSGAPALYPVYEETENGQQGDIIGWRVPYTRQRGFKTVRLEDDLDDRETYLDLRNDPPACDSEWEREYTGADKPSLPGGMEAQYKAFPASLESQGRTLLQTDYPIVTSLDTGDLRMDRYLKDYDLGDLVDMAVERLGIVKEARITGVQEVYESGSSTITLEIGDEKLDVIKKARLTT